MYVHGTRGGWKEVISGPNFAKSATYCRYKSSLTQRYLGPLITSFQPPLTQNHPVYTITQNCKGYPNIQNCQLQDHGYQATRLAPPRELTKSTVLQITLPTCSSLPGPPPHYAAESATVATFHATKHEGTSPS